MKNVAVLCNSWSQFVRWFDLEMKPAVGVTCCAYSHITTPTHRFFCITPSTNPDQFRGTQWSYSVCLKYEDDFPYDLLVSIRLGRIDPYSAKKSKKDQLIEELQQKLKELQEEI